MIKLLYWKWCKLLILLFYKNHKINTDYSTFQTQAKKQAKELENNFKKNPQENAEYSWEQHQQNLLDSIINKDLGKFLRWPEVKKPMFYEAKIEQFYFLKKKKDFFKDKLKLTESSIGAPNRYPFSTTFKWQFNSSLLFFNTIIRLL